MKQLFLILCLLALANACSDDFSTFGPSAQNGAGAGTGAGAGGGDDTGGAGGLSVGGGGVGGGLSEGGAGGGSGGTEEACDPASGQSCQEQFLSDFCPTAEDNTHQCLQFNKPYWQPKIIIDGVTYTKGLGMHAPAPGAEVGADCQYHSDLPYEDGIAKVQWQLGGKFNSFSAVVGLAEVNGEDPTTGEVMFTVRLDDEETWSSGIVTGETAPIPLQLDVTGAETMTLTVDSLGDNGSDTAVWADARLLPECNGQ